jgi:hypothetical protein
MLALAKSYLASIIATMTFTEEMRAWRSILARLTDRQKDALVALLEALPKTS